MSGLPVEVAAQFIAAGDQGGGITGAAGEDFFGDIGAGDAADYVDNLANGVTGAGADVESAAG